MVDVARMKMLVFAGLILSLAACSDEREASYATRDDAERAGAIERGWIPPFVPKSARKISEQHNLDTNAQRLTFVVPPNEVRPMLAEITPQNSLQGQLAQKALVESGREDEDGQEVEVIVLCTRSNSSAVIANHKTGLVTFLSPVEWARERCPRPH